MQRRELFAYVAGAAALCTTMKAEDVTATLELALQAAGLHEAKPAQRLRTAWSRALSKKAR